MCNGGRFRNREGVARDREREGESESEGDTSGEVQKRRDLR